MLHQKLSADFQSKADSFHMFVEEQTTEHNMSTEPFNMHKILLMLDTFKEDLAKDLPDWLANPFLFSWYIFDLFELSSGKFGQYGLLDMGRVYMG